MIKNVADILDSDYDRTTQAVEFPECFDNIKSDDANFEMATSNTLLPMRLIRQHNVVTHSIAAIFCNTFLEVNSY